MALRPILSLEGDVTIRSGVVANPGTVRSVEGFEGISNDTVFTHRPEVVEALARLGSHEVSVVYTRNALRFDPPLPMDVVHAVVDVVLASGRSDQVLV